MAEVEVGRSSFMLDKSSESTWTLGVSNEGDSLGPNIIMQKGINLLFIRPTIEEAKILIKFLKDYIK